MSPGWPEKRVRQEVALGECSGSATAEEDSWLNFFSLGTPLEKKIQRKKMHSQFGL